MHKRFGFTLAEVLITLGIIGIVAAMTLPSLITKYQKRVLENQVKQFYAQMLQAVKKAMADEETDKVTNLNLLYNADAWESDDPDNIFLSNSEIAKKFLYKYFKVVNDCGPVKWGADTEKKAVKKCFADKYKAIQGGSVEPYLTSSGSYSGGYCVVIASGASVCLTPGNWGYPAYVQFDVNGKKGPNKSGYDWLSFSIYYDGTISEGMAPNYSEDYKIQINERYENVCPNTAAYGAGCFGHLLLNGFKMDY